MSSLALQETQGEGRSIGLALGSGAARGWAHIGVIRALAAAGIRPDVVCGTSIGALVGAALASSRLDALADWALGLEWPDVLALFDLGLKGGLLRGDRIIQHCERHFFAADFSQLELRFAAVATELSTGHEVWLHEGRVGEAVRASIALPGLFAPQRRNSRTLVDGGLVNPVPVSLCRAMGADVVIAVELGSDVVGRTLRRDPKSLESGDHWGQRLLSALGWGGEDNAEESLPSLAAVLSSSVNIMQQRIARSRLAGEPADVLLSPRLAQIGILEFDRAQEAVAEGEAAVERMLPQLRHVLGEEV